MRDALAACTHTTTRLSRSTRSCVRGRSAPVAEAMASWSGRLWADTTAIAAWVYSVAVAPITAVGAWGPPCPRAGGRANGARLSENQPAGALNERRWWLLRKLGYAVEERISMAKRLS